MATVALTVVPIVVAVALAPSSGSTPTTALVWLLFVGSSAHVGATAWFYTVPEVRGHMRSHRARYLVVPSLLVLGTAVAVASVPTRLVTWLLLAYFGWQFFHFQKQNLGVAALAARAGGADRLSTPERRALTAAGAGGVAALVGHPALLQLDRTALLATRLHRLFDTVFVLGAVTFAGAVAVGLVSLARRPEEGRPLPFVVVYAVSLLFFAPVFCFASPYAAVAGLTIAHGLQYLLLMGLISGAPSNVAPARVGVLILVNLALVVGLLLNQASHLHAGTTLLDRCLFGAYLGVVMSHFVVDAGLWRLREEFPRTFLTGRLPYLLAPEGRAATAPGAP